MPQVIATSVVRARKDHRCSWHPWTKGGDDFEPHVIKKGELYIKHANTDNGMMWTWKSCAYHRAAAEAMFDIWQLDELGEYEFSDNMHEWWCEAMGAADRGMSYPMPFDAHEEFKESK